MYKIQILYSCVYTTYSLLLQFSSAEQLSVCFSKSDFFSTILWLLLLTLLLSLTKVNFFVNGAGSSKIFILLPRLTLFTLFAKKIHTACPTTRNNSPFSDYFIINIKFVLWDTLRTTLFTTFYFVEPIIFTVSGYKLVLSLTYYFLIFTFRKSTNCNQYDYVINIMLLQLLEFHHGYFKHLRLSCKFVDISVS